MEENKTRINKFLSESGFFSRREADKLIEQGPRNHQRTNS